MASDDDLNGRKLHFIAIGGAGMSALALVCHSLGARVSGSDRSESSYLRRLRDAGLEPRLGHDADSVPPDAEVVISTAIPDDNPELVRARERGQRVMHRGELLAELCATKRLLAIAGTHGKTTTAAMATWALRGLGAEPAFVLGGELAGAGAGGSATNAGWGDGEWIVAEADESDASFLELRPEVAIVTNVELDHHSQWSSRAALIEAFARFAAPARAVVLPDDSLAGSGRSLGLDSIAGGSAGCTRFQACLRFDAAQPGPDLELQVPGAHNLLNARSALAGLELAGFPLDRAAQALADFPGVRRRLERIGERGGAVVYDDYAHHPTEVAAALAAVRDLGPRRLIAVFQPHLYSRTKALASDFGSALASADVVGVLEVYPAREEPVGELSGVTGRWVAEAAAERAGGRPVWWLKDADTATRVLGERMGEGDLVLTLGAGDIGERVAAALVGG